MINRFTDENGKPLGLIEQIREHEANQREINLEEELSKPYRKPNTDTVYGGIEFIKKFNESLNE